jgi:phosphoribosylaminoimidazole-succinocarboxamide synthase
MAIDFRDPLWEFLQDTKQEFAMEVPCIIQTEDEVVTPDTSMFEPRLREYNPREK